MTIAARSLVHVIIRLGLKVEPGRVIRFCDRPLRSLHKEKNGKILNTHFDYGHEVQA